MSKFTHIQNNFTAGQFSPRSLGRIDWEAYKRGAAEIQDLLPNKNGTISSRPGTRRVFEIEGFGTTVRGFEFKPLSTDNKYIVVLRAGTLSTSATSTDTVCEIYNISGTQKTLNTGITSSPRIVHPVVVSDVDLLIPCQVGDLLFFCHKDGSERPFYIRFNSDSDFSINPWGDNIDYDITEAPVDYRFMIPWKTRNTFQSVVLGYLNGSGTAGDDNFDFTTGGGSAELTNLVGSRIKVNYSGATTVLKINSFGSGQVDATREAGPDLYTAGLRDGDDIDDFHFPAWSDSEGWPNACVFFEQRLIWVKGNQLYGSLVGNIFFTMSEKLLQHTNIDSATNANFDRIGYFGELANTDAFAFEVCDRDIEWISSGRVLQYGTDEDEWVISGGEQILGPLSVTNKKQTSYGAQNVDPIRVGDSALFVSEDGKKVRDFKFNDYNGTHLSDDLNDFSEDIVDFGFDGETDSDSKARQITQIKYQSSRDTVWARVGDNSQLLSCLLDKNPERPRIAWAYHTIQGTNVEILSVMMFENSNSSFKDVYLLLKRDINSSTKLVVEKIGPDFTHDFLSNESTNEDDRCWTLDGAVRDTNGSPTTNYTVSEYPGETLDIIADGIYVGQKTADGSGNITLDTAASEIISGFKFTPRLRFLPIEMGGDFGNAMMQVMKLDEVTLRLYKSKSCTIRSMSNNHEDSVNITSEENELFTGDIENHRVSDNADQRGQLELKVDKPYPFTLLAIGVKGELRVG